MLEKIKQDSRSKFHLEEGEEIVHASSILNSISLPDDFKICLLYWCTFIEGRTIAKEWLVRLLVAGGLIQEKPGHLMGDKAQETVETLFDFESYTKKTPEDVPAN